MEYSSAKETAKKWGISKRRVQILCSEGRVIGAIKVGSNWIIPSDASKPKKLKSGPKSSNEVDV